ncbi:MAG: UbiA family prenyltransferase [Nitrospirae bacterium]|nr:UbiA family prenyltransferase [Nitrospirota bacterium]
MNKTFCFEKTRIILEMIKFSHTLFALPFAFMGAILSAREIPSPTKIFWIIAAMLGARSAAMFLNRLIDWRIDALNPRTKDRAIPKGLITPAQTVVLIIISFLLFFLAAYMLNPLCLMLTPLASAILILYSYTKRFTWASHLILGLALSMAPMGAWIAVAGRFELPALILGIAVMFWLAGFDILYALQDIEFDKKMGLYSIPRFLGIKKSLLLSRGFHFLMVIFLLLLYPVMGLGRFYLIGIAAALSLLIYEHSLIKEHDLSKINIAFFNANAYVSLCIFIFTLIDVVI